MGQEIIGLELKYYHKSQLASLDTYILRVRYMCYFLFTVMIIFQEEGAVLFF